MRARGACVCVCGRLRGSIGVIGEVTAVVLGEARRECAFACRSVHTRELRCKHTRALWLYEGRGGGGGGGGQGSRAAELVARPCPKDWPSGHITAGN